LAQKKVLLGQAPQSVVFGTFLSLGSPQRFVKDSRILQKASLYKQKSCFRKLSALLMRHFCLFVCKKAR
jgi:hypothetical protein